jgi:transketolase
MGDGCMMEGVSHEACSLAGALGLGKLTAFWDDNGISIDGPVSGWWRDDTPARFEAYGWHVVRGVDGHDAAALDAAIAAAAAVADKPSLICCKTIIGCGAPHAQGSHTCHGSPLGDEEIAATRKALGWTAAPFVIPDEIYAAWDAREAGGEAEAAWNESFAAYRAAYPAEGAEFERRMRGELPAGWAEKAAAVVRAVAAKGEVLATRKGSQAAIKAFAELLPEFLGGSADLTPSNGTRIPAYQDLTTENFAGRYLSYGVREFGMGAVMNGLALHGGLLPYGGTFLIFSDYARNAIRMAALMKQRVIWVLTHDSIGVGEDGPTHQPVEQVPSLRLIPGLEVWRPCDTVECAVAWKAGIEAHGPTALALTRQKTGFAPRTDAQIAAVERGGYVLDDCDGAPDALLIATGSEVFLALEAKKLLAAEGKKIRVVSMPCAERFDAQDAAWRDAVLPPAVTARVAVEAARGDGWYKYVGLAGTVVCMHSFGASAPAPALFERFGLTPAAVAAAVRSVL